MAVSDRAADPADVTHLTVSDQLFPGPAKRKAQSMNEPAKPWRVHAATGFTTDHRSMATAFEQVKVVHAWGLTASVYRWNDGEWRLYRELEPPRAQSSEDSWPF